MSLKKICIEQFSAEEIFRLVYLGESIPKNSNYHIIQIIKFLRRRKSKIKYLKYDRDIGNTHVHIQLDAMDLSPSDLVLLDKFIS